MWSVEHTDEFADWWKTLTEEEQVNITASVGLLEERGPNLKHPHSSGNKTGDDRWYEKYVPVADKLYEQHIETLKKEGLIDE